MNEYQLGANLRRQILGDLDRGLPMDGRRLQALVGDFCGESQSGLLPALRYLVMAPAFASAVGQQPPLPPDRRLQLRLQQELNQVFAAPICQRMETVLRGLLGLPAPTAGAGSSPSPASPASPPPQPRPEPARKPQPLRTPRAASRRSQPPAAPIAPAPIPPPPPAQGRGLVAVLSFMAGVLMVGVGGGLAWLLLQGRQPSALIPAEPSALPPPAAVDPSPSPPASTPAPPPPDLTVADVSQAITSVQALYGHLSSGTIEAARQLIGGEAASQFDPSFFSQFRRVSVGDLRETSRQGSTVTLQGVVQFEFPDGSSQSELRSFTVDTATTPALITASSFEQVLKARERQEPSAAPGPQN